MIAKPVESGVKVNITFSPLFTEPMNLYWTLIPLPTPMSLLHGQLL